MAKIGKNLYFGCQKNNFLMKCPSLPTRPSVKYDLLDCGKVSSCFKMLGVRRRRRWKGPYFHIWWIILYFRGLIVLTEPFYRVFLFSKPNHTIPNLLPYPTIPYNVRKSREMFTKGSCEGLKVGLIWGEIPLKGQQSMPNQTKPYQTKPNHAMPYQAMSCHTIPYQEGLVTGSIA